MNARLLLVRVLPGVICITLAGYLASTGVPWTTWCWFLIVGVLML